MKKGWILFAPSNSVKSQPQPYCADTYLVKKTLSATPRPLYHWKVESLSFPTVLGFWGGLIWVFHEIKSVKIQVVFCCVNTQYIEHSPMKRYAYMRKMVCKGFSFAHHLNFLYACMLCKLVISLTIRRYTYKMTIFLYASTKISTGETQLILLASRRDLLICV